MTTFERLSTNVYIPAAQSAPAFTFSLRYYARAYGVPNRSDMNLGIIGNAGLELSLQIALDSILWRMLA